MMMSKDPLGQDALIAEASRWLAALDAGSAQPEAFEAWRQASPAHAVAYARVAASWESAAAAGPMATEPAVADASESVVEPAPATANRRQWLRAAAVALPVMMLGSGFFAQRAYAWDNATTRVGEKRRVPLPDGSVAYLNTDSSLSWRFTAGKRMLRLDRGELALDLRPGGAAVLRANDAALPLAPGLFDARIRDGHAELTLVDGAAMPLPGGDRAMVLHPKMSVIVDQDRAPRLQPRSTEQVESLMAWRAGEIVFLDQSVAEATADFNRHLTRKIIVTNPDLAREKIGGRFDLNRPDQFLQAVSLSLDARVVATPGGYELTR
ncbi:transmembrane sensor [Sphingomonas zeicaulis]